MRAKIYKKDDSIMMELIDKSEIDEELIKEYEYGVFQSLIESDYINLNGRFCVGKYMNCGYNIAKVNNSGLCKYKYITFCADTRINNQIFDVMLFEKLEDAVIDLMTMVSPSPEIFEENKVAYIDALEYGYDPIPGDVLLTLHKSLNKK